jgi:tetratricopeptide (TPR) repeat protein
MAKRVFLSSVFKTLKDVRKAVHDLLIKLDYEVWWAEEHPQLEILPSDPVEANNLVRAVCLQGIESSDIYLGIYPTRYGSDPCGLAFTELEYLHAVSASLPRFLYVLPDRHFVTDDQKIKQRGSLYLIKDQDLSAVKPVAVSSRAELLTKIETDFEQLSQDSQTSELYPWTAPCIERVQSSSQLIVPEAPIDLTISEATALLRSLSNQSFQEAAVLGLVYIQRFFAKPDWRNRRFVKDLDAFLETWNYVAAWAGVCGSLGQTNISKVRIVLHQMLNDYLGVYDIAGAVASGLYGERKIRVARKWYDLSRRFERHFNKIPWLRGHLELAEGDLASARASFLDILMTPALDDYNRALYLSNYGLCLIKEGDRRSGLRHLDEAINIKTLPATFSTRLYRSNAKAYLHIGEIDSAIQSCDIAASHAREHNLKGQLRKALWQRQKIVSNSSSNY